MSKLKCECPKDYDCCVCGYEKPPKKVKGIKQTKVVHYCHNCLDDGVLVRLVLKPVAGGSRREYFCSRCAEETGAGYYSGGGYTIEKAAKKLEGIKRRAEKIAKEAAQSLGTLKIIAWSRK